MAYITVALYFSVLYISLNDFIYYFLGFMVDDSHINMFNVLLFLYIIMVLTLIFYSINTTANSKESVPIFYAISTILGLYMLGTFVLMAWSISKYIFLMK